jgi:hypothetical protein
MDQEGRVLCVHASWADFHCYLDVLRMLWMSHYGKADDDDDLVKVDGGFVVAVYDVAGGEWGRRTEEVWEDELRMGQCSRESLAGLPSPGNWIEAMHLLQLSPPPSVTAVSCHFGAKDYQN